MQIEQPSLMAAHKPHTAAEELSRGVIRKFQHQVKALREDKQKYRADHYGGGSGQHGGREPVHIFTLQKHNAANLARQLEDHVYSGKKAGQNQTFFQLPSEAVEQIGDIIATLTGHIQKEQRVSRGKDIGKHGNYHIDQQGDQYAGQNRQGQVKLKGIKKIGL